jgi:hypothetical protein
MPLSASLAGKVSFLAGKAGNSPQLKRLSPSVRRQSDLAR